MHTLRCTLTSLLFVGVSLAQQFPPTTPTQPLAPKLHVQRLSASGEPTATALAATASFGPITCQDSGIYIRPVGPDTMPLKSNLVRVSSGADSTVRTFAFSAAPQLQGKEWVAPSYTVDRFGRVYALARILNPEDRARERVLLLEFASDGSFNSAAELSMTIWPQSLTALPGDRLLITGLDRAPYEEKSDKPVQQLVAIFNREGKLNKLLRSGIPQEQDGGARLSVGVSDTAVGPDGHFYVLKTGPHIGIDVWSDSGEKLSEFAFDPPLDSARVTDLKVTQGVFAIRFVGPVKEDPSTKRGISESVWAVYDALDGRPIGYYDMSAIKGLLVCFEPERLTFLVPKMDRFATLSVSLR